MVRDFVVTVQLEVEDQGCRSTHRDEFFSDSSYEFIGVFAQVSWEAIDSKVDCGQVLDNGIVGKDTDVGSGSKR